MDNTIDNIRRDECVTMLQEFGFMVYIYDNPVCIVGIDASEMPPIVVLIRTLDDMVSVRSAFERLIQLSENIQLDEAIEASHDNDFLKMISSIEGLDTL